MYAVSSTNPLVSTAYDVTVCCSSTIQACFLMTFHINISIKTKELPLSLLCDKLLSSLRGHGAWLYAAECTVDCPTGSPPKNKSVQFVLLLEIFKFQGEAMLWVKTGLDRTKCFGYILSKNI